MTAQHRQVPDLVLERFFLGELDGQAAQQVRELLATDTALQQRLKAIEMSNAQVMARYEPEDMARRIASRATSMSFASPRRVAWRWPVLAAVPVAAAVVLVLVFAPLSPPSTPANVPEPIRIKGDTGPALFVYRQRGTKEELLVDGQVATSGDVLQLRYSGRGKGFGLIFSLDGRGKVTRHLPAQGGDAVALPKSGVGTLPVAYALDDAPQFERFYFVAADRRFEIDQILLSAEDLAAGVRTALLLPSGVVAVSFTVVKH